MTRFILEEALKELDTEIQKELSSVPFDEGLTLLREKIWGVADKFNLDGAEVFKLYMDMKSKNAL